MDRREAIISLTTVLGYSVTPASIISLSSSCGKPLEGISWNPQFFKHEDAALVEKLGEVILPGTDTPGSLEVGAHIFVDSFLKNVAKQADQEKCLRGIAIWNDDYEKRNGKKLESVSADELHKELTNLFGIDGEEQKRINQLITKNTLDSSDDTIKYYLYSFLMMVKKLVMLGYFASEEIGENVLSYLPVPGKYEGCISQEEVTYSWSL